MKPEEIADKLWSKYGGHDYGITWGGFSEAIKEAIELHDSKYKKALEEIAAINPIDDDYETAHDMKQIAIDALEVE